MEAADVAEVHHVGQDRVVVVGRRRMVRLPVVVCRPAALAYRTTTAMLYPECIALKPSSN
jgi:hypothetical protein